jgi:hypothetical protein
VEAARRLVEEKKARAAEAEEALRNAMEKSLETERAAEELQKQMASAVQQVDNLSHESQEKRYEIHQTCHDRLLPRESTARTGIPDGPIWNKEPDFRV